MPAPVEDATIGVMPKENPSALRVVIAGAGVAGLEAMLALGELAGDRVEVEVLSPARQFVYRPMLVAEPFGTARALRLDLDPIIAAAGAHHRMEAMIGAELGDRTVRTSAGRSVHFDALVVTLGGRPSEAVPGAITFDASPPNPRLERLLRMLGSRRVRRVAFVVPQQPSWTIAAYELALMTAAERDDRSIPGVEISLVTAEHAPLALFGEAASRLVRRTLEDAGIAIVTAARATRVVDGQLELESGQALAVDEVVALPELTVPDLPGLPQRAGGFLPTDAGMHVGGFERVWAAGDVTHFPVKQGGIAAQQADVAASAIAALAGARVAVAPFRPVLRGALITGGAPEFLEARLSDPAAGIATVGQPLWTPSIKMAAKYLGPYLSRALRGGTTEPEFRDLDDSGADRTSQPRSERAVEAAIDAADSEAARGDYEAALRWISFVEQLDLALPAELVARRERWRRELDPRAVAHPAAGRMDPSFATPEQAISDIRRRIGWLREAEQQEGEEMSARLARLQAGLDDLIKLSRRTGTLAG
jgi:sulfide:quinone oxidoreductase